MLKRSYKANCVVNHFILGKRISNLFIAEEQLSVRNACFKCVSEMSEMTQL